MKTATPATSADVAASNLVVMRGTVANEPTMRDLAGGASVLQLDIATKVRSDVSDAVVTNTVPVAWYDPTPAQVRSLEVGLDVVIVGSVRRRFFRVGGQTQSRTEVVVDRAMPARRRTSVRSSLMAAAAEVSRAVEQQAR